MIFLDYLYNLPNSTSGMDQITSDLLVQVPFVTPLILLFVFLLIFIGGIVRQTVRTGSADYPSWAVVASISTLLPTLALSVSSGFINLDVLIIVVTLNILSATWLFLDRRITEV